MFNLKTKLIIFDIDGTLTNSQLEHHAAYLAAFDKLGFKKLNEDFSSYQHYTDSGIFAEAYFNEYGKKASKQDIKNFEQLHLEQFKDVLQISRLSEVAGARQFLLDLEDSEWAISFATGSFLPSALVKLDECNIPYKHDVLATASENYKRDKIVLSALKKAADYYGSDFNKVVVFGDGIWDYKTAQKLGLELIGIGYGKNAEILIDQGVTLFEDFLDKEAILNHLNSAQISKS